MNSREQDMNVALGGAVDLGATETCKVCGIDYIKHLPGINICGHCQVAMAIVMNWQAVLYHRWGVIYIR